MSTLVPDEPVSVRVPLEELRGAGAGIGDMRWMWRDLVLSRVLVWGVAITALILFGVDRDAVEAFDPRLLTQPFHSLALNRLVAPGARWDSVWYVHVATHGYDSPSTTAFFPLYPLIVGLVADVVGSPVIAGILVSLTCMTASAVLLYRLALLDLSEPASRLAVSLFLFFPASLFLSAVYTESMFMLLCLGAVLCARTDRWAVAGVCGALAAATRLNGALIVVPLAVIALYGPRAGLALRPASTSWRPRYRLQPAHLWLLLVPCGAGAFFAYQWIVFGAPFETLRVEALVWHHQFAGPFGGIWLTLIHLPGDIGHLLTGAPTLGTGDPLSWNAHHLIDIAFVAVAVLLLVFARRRLPVAYTSYVIALILIVSSDPTSLEPLQCIPRYLLTAFPLFIAAAGYLEEHPQHRRASLTLSVAGLIAFSALWGIWAWVG